MRRLPDAAARGKEISIELDGEALPAVEGEPVACALIAAGEETFCRAPGDGRPLGAFCFAAACSHCRMRVDGQADVYTCLTPARPGMRLERQVGAGGAPHAARELFEWLLPGEQRGGAPVDESAAARAVAALAGLGQLPLPGSHALLAAHELKTCVAVVGGGAAGLAAAEVLGAHGVPFLLFEREARIGGRLRFGPLEPEAPAVLDPGALPSSSLRRSCLVVALQEDAAGRYLLALAFEPEGVRPLKVYAARFLLAVGGQPSSLSFPGNDLPGVYAGRAASRLLRAHHLAPESAALVGWGPELYGMARLCASHGTRVLAVVDLRGPLPREVGEGACIGAEPEAHGPDRLRAFSFTPQGGARRTVSCGALLVCLPPSPALELARQGGARVVHDAALGAAVVEVDEAGRTQAPDVFAAGDLVGALDARSAAAGGRRVAEALVRALSW